VAAAGIPVWIDARTRIAHEKALIIDRRVTIMGSYNFSASAARDSEDLNVVTSPEVAETYARHWQARQAGAIRFADASDGANGDRATPLRRPVQTGPDPLCRCVGSHAEYPFGSFNLVASAPPRDEGASQRGVEEIEGNVALAIPTYII